MSDIDIKKGQQEVVFEEVVPTLFIGLGGTGAEILWKIRRRILNTLWGPEKNVRIENLTEFPLADFLHIDLDSSTITEQGKAQNTDILSKKISFKEEERVVKTLDLSKYTRTDEDLLRYPLIHEWFPLSRTKINELNIPVEKGAGQIRSFSRLYFFDRYQEIKSAIRAKSEHLLSNVSTEKSAKRLGLKVKTGRLKVVAVASTAGGTGSGCFLDLGYLVQLINDNKNTETNLVMLLPTGYQGANRTRTKANTYAALMELETCMRQGSNFIHEWSESESVISRSWPESPYGDIYFIDTVNLTSSRTEDVKDIYNMVADALFEDFSTADFANRKRSISVNQNLHKTNPYVARLSKEEYGNMRLTFSRGYSSFGQATIDMHIEQKKNVLLYRQVNDMLRVFFGVSADDIKTNTPTDKDRDEILSTRMYLRLENEIINNIFVVNDESFKKGVERTTYALVKELLRVKGISRLDDIDKQITERFEEIRTGGNFKGWRDKIAEAIADINRDTFKGIESGTGLHEELVRRRRQELLADLLDGQKENSFIRALWSRVDNKERGGLDYTIQLVHSIKDKLENNEVGIIKILKDNAKWFSDLSGFLRTKETDSLMEHLDQAFRKIIGAHIQSEMKLKQIADVVKLYVRYHMISIASREAAKLVEEFADRLARQVGTDENGMPIWTGFVGELEEGRRLVKNIIGDLDKQINLTQEAMRQSHAMYFGLSGAANSIDKVDLVSPVKAQQWAEDAFKDFGGTQNLFSMLQDEEGRVDLITKLQNRAMELISEQSEQNVENPLFSALDAQLNLGQLGQTFSDFLNMAMPWVSARIDGYLKELDPNDQYKCYIGVKDSVRFESKYGALLKSRLPTSTMITSQEIKFVEIDTPGKVVCYTELSGLPLPALTGLNEWYTSYREENDKTPVHTHRSTSTFVHPRELTTDELASRAADFKIFIQAVATGLLTRVQKGEEKGLYKVWIRGHAKYVGDEKCLRMEGFTTTYRDEVSRQLELDIDQLQSSDQVGLWVALLEYYSNSVYPLRDLILDRKTVDQKSLPTLVCEQLVTDWKTRFNRMLGSAHAENILQRARAALDKWSDIVPDSRNDVYHYEINEKDAMPKRALKREVFKLDWKLDGGGTVFSCYVALDGKAEGPYELDKLRELARKGALTELTKVWKNGMADWGFAKDFDELSGLLVQPSPIVPPPLHNVPPPLGGNV